MAGTDRNRRLKATAALNASLVRGLADADAGRTRRAAQVFDRLEAKYRAKDNAAILSPE